MKPAVWIAIYLPLFILFFLILPSRKKAFLVAQKIRKKRGHHQMPNELIKECLGKICTISTGSIDKTYKKVKVVEIIDNWLKVENKGNIDLINTDFVHNIKILS